MKLQQFHLFGDNEQWNQLCVVSCTLEKIIVFDPTNPISEETDYIKDVSKKWQVVFEEMSNGIKRVLHLAPLRKS